MHSAFSGWVGIQVRVGIQVPVTFQLEPDFYAAFSESSALWSRFVLRIAPGRGLETEASQTRSHLLLYRMARNGVCFYSGYHAAVWHRHARRTIGDKGRRCSQIEATPGSFSGQAHE